MARSYHCGKSSFVPSLLIFVASLLTYLSIFEHTSRSGPDDVRIDSNHFRAFRNEIDETFTDDNVGQPQTTAGDSIYPSDPSDDCILDRKFMPEGSMPLILLLSFPGSGNTWVRYLLERSSGIYSGSIYNDVGTGVTDDAIFRKSPDCSKSTIVVKAHDIPTNRLKKCDIDGAIFLIRNPYGAILAEFNRQRSGKKGTASSSAFHGSKWENFAITKADLWSEKLKSQLDHIPNRLIVFYEDLVQHTDFELRRMLDFLHVTPNEKRIQCLLRQLEGNFKRKHKNLGFNPFSLEINNTIDKNIQNVRNIMNRAGYSLPTYESYS